MSNLVSRLRYTHDSAPSSEDWCLCCEAADEIERLTWLLNNTAEQVAELEKRQADSLEKTGWG